MASVPLLCVRSRYSCLAIVTALTLRNTEGKEMGRRMVRALPVVITNPVLTEAISGANSPIAAEDNVTCVLQSLGAEVGCSVQVLFL